MLFDTKKFGSKLSSIIWFILYLLPLIILFISMCKLSFSEITYSDFSQWYNAFNTDYITEVISPFDSYCLSWANWNWLQNYGVNLDFVIILLNWFTTITLIHLMFDIILLIPSIAHKFIRKFHKFFGGVNDEK